MKWSIQLLTLVGGLACLAGHAVAADWPMWRHDAARSNASTAELPDQLELRWTRQLPAPRPAWPASQAKLQYDRSYEPIVAGKLLFVGSMVDDSVAAFDTETGEEKWRFFTDGPVRFAPVFYKDRIYATSDDGFLYCLQAADGSLRWKVRAAPAERRILGNDRLISTWPIRGGAVVADDTVYLTASIWPFMGVFVQALDAETGQPRWINSETGGRWVTHPHGAPSFGSIVPQGYLAVSGDALIVPGGRSLPAVFHRETGALAHFDFGGKGSGGYQVIAGDGYYAVGREVFALADGKKVGSVPLGAIGKTLLVSPQGSSIRGLLAAEALQQKRDVDRKGKSREELKFNPQSAWQVKASHNALLLAGNQLYIGSEQKVARYAVSEEEPQSTWQAEIDGTAWSLVAADDKLFAVTEAGKLYCFGAAAGDAEHHEQPRKEMPPSPPKVVADVESLLEQARTREGYALVFGLESGQTVAELVRQSNYHVIVIDPRADRVQQLRRTMQAAGWYGTRVVAHVGDPSAFAVPPYFANLVTSEDLAVMGKEAQPRVLFEPLRPYGGVCCLPLSQQAHAAFEKAVQALGVSNAVCRRIKGLTVLQRAGALPESAPWTHQYADAANSVVSKDRRVKAPFGLLWFGGPSNDKILPRHGHGPNPQVAGGRVVIEGPDMLRAVDVYTGRVWWEKELPGVGDYYNTTRHFAGANEIGSNYVTMPDRVYVVYGTALLELDAATGEETRRFQLESAGDEPPAWGYVSAHEELLVAASSPVKISVGDQAAKPALSPNLKPLIKQGETWQYLAGKDPAAEWVQVDFDASDWKTGQAGFGYGDDDDRTKLKGMRGKFRRVYLRKTFERKDVARGSKGVLVINYDDAFIAYLNGREIVRAGVGSGQGSDAEKIRSHEARKFETFPIEDFEALLRDGPNVLAIEGHNVSLTSSDFTLDPYLAVQASEKVADKPQEDSVRQALEPAKYASASRKLVLFDRRSGRMLWQRQAEFNFRHNSIVLAEGKVFCIDGMSEAKLDLLKRRGIEPQRKPRLLCLDAKTGREIWSTDQDVFGTFLNYSAEHDVLLQGGSAYRDRAGDEVQRGMVAYRGRDGELLWKNLEVVYNGPCLLWRDKIITNGRGGFSLELQTGEKTGWSYGRMYGCNTAIGSEHLLTFRSGAAGFFDLATGSGTGNIGGFRSSCTSNLIPADGVLNAPDYTRTCSCAYQNQTSLALVHMPEAELWTFNVFDEDGSMQKRIGLNFGAPGDRRSPQGTLWLDSPSVGGHSPRVEPDVQGDPVRYLRHHSARMKFDDAAESLPWVGASAVIGAQSVRIPVDSIESKTCTVRLYFAELEDKSAGQRVFDVAVNDKAVLNGFDIAKAAGGSLRTVVKTFSNLPCDKELVITLTPREGQTSLSGVEVVGD